MMPNNNSKISKQELISTFTDIDQKINKLHQRSSSDFMHLNNFLKDYHKKTRLISENAFRIFETISGEKDMDLIKELGSVHGRFDNMREKISDEESQRLEILKEIILKSNQLNIILRNLRQDFTTLKFLSVNYSLISNYKASDNEWDKNLEIWDAEIQKVPQSLTAISDQVDRFKDIVLALIDSLETRIEKFLLVFHDLSRDTKINIGAVVQKSKDSKLQFPMLKEKSTNSLKSISNIITHLQYQDIIRQKIEHIQSSHQKIINDLQGSIVKQEIDEDCMPSDIVKIGDIIDLQTAQLLLVSKEYQNALNIITSNFQEIARDITTITSISDKFSFKDNNSSITLIKQIKDQLDKGIILLDLNHFNEFNNEGAETAKVLSGISEMINNGIAYSFTSLEKFTDTENAHPKIDISGLRIISQIVALTRDIEVKFNDMKVKTSEIMQQSKGVFTSEETDNWGNQLEIDRLQLMVSISKILDTLDKDNEELDNVLIENRELNKNIFERIESTINRGDYYDFFEKIVEQVISQLNSINQKIKPSLSHDMISEKAANLRDIKTTYTMETERIIHDKVVAGETGIEIGNQQEDDNEIEFF